VNYWFWVNEFIDTKLAGRTTINQSLILRVFVVDFEDILWHADDADFQTQIFADLKKIDCLYLNYKTESS
jgi:hypothetical protein